MGASGRVITTADILDKTILPADLNGGGAVNRLITTTDGVNAAWGQLVAAMVDPAGAVNRILSTGAGGIVGWNQLTAAMVGAGAVGSLPGVALGALSMASSAPAPITGAALDWTPTAKPALVIVSFRDVTAAAALTWTVQLYDAAALVTTMLVDTIPDTITRKNVTALFYTSSLGSGAKHHTLLWNVSAANAVNVAGVTFAILELH